MQSDAGVLNNSPTRYKKRLGCGDGFSGAARSPSAFHGQIKALIRTPEMANAYITHIQA